MLRFSLKKSKIIIFQIEIKSFAGKNQNFSLSTASFFFCLFRYRVTVSDDLNQTGRNFHLASIQFTTSKSDVLFRLSIFDNQDEVTNVEGKGTVVLPAFLFMRDVTNTSQTGNASAAPPSSTTTAAAAAGPPTTSRPQSKTGGAIKKDGGKNSGGTTQRGSVAETGGIGSGKSDKEKTGSGKRSVSRTKEKKIRNCNIFIRTMEFDSIRCFSSYLMRRRKLFK